MSRECFDGKKNCPIFIKMGTKSMTEGMAGETMLPPQTLLMGMNMSGEKKGLNGSVLVLELLWKQPVRGLATSKPVMSKDIQSRF